MIISKSPYKRCTVTVMDTTDPEITFNNKGECNYVTAYRDNLLKVWNPRGDYENFQKLIKRIKFEGKNKNYDCIIGLSGGVDSSYLVYLAWKNGLRPLIVHTDTGWNSELAVQNIENMIKKTGFDLYTHVVYWPQMMELQKAFLYAGVPNQDIPQDHAIFASFYKIASKFKIKWVLNGSNHATESVLPKAWGYDSGDYLHIKSIFKKYGVGKLNKYPKLGYNKYLLKFLILNRLKIVKPLNLIHYRKDKAIEVLENEFNWKYYGAKHFESRFCKFFQGWYLPEKFGFDKRIAHLSSLILNKELTREQALIELEKKQLSNFEINQEKEFIQKKLKMNDNEFNKIINSKTNSHFKYKNMKPYLDLLINIKNKFSM